MFRKLVLAALLATGTLGGVTVATAAPAPDLHEHDRGRFQVLVRHRFHWDVHGTYRDRDDAQRAARRLERQGFDTRIQRVHR